MMTDHHTEKLRIRETLTNEIVADVDDEVGDLLAWASDSLPAEDHKAIRDEVIAETRQVTDALTTEELQNEGARRSYTRGVLVRIPNGRNLNREIVRAGFASWYRQYARHDAELKKLEGKARAAKRRLWADKNPVPPWAWRKPPKN